MNMGGGCFNVKIRRLWAVIYLLIMLLTCPLLSHAQTEPILSGQIRQVPEEIVALIIKNDICSLVDLLEIPPVPKREWRSFFSKPSKEEIQIRVQRDELLRRFMDCIREYMIVFSRLSVTESAKMTYNTLPANTQDHFVSEIEIETFTSALADTIRPNLANRKILLTFKVNFKYSGKGWSITNIFDFNIHPD